MSIPEEPLSEEQSFAQIKARVELFSQLLRNYQEKVLRMRHLPHCLMFNKVGLVYIEECYLASKEWEEDRKKYPILGIDERHIVVSPLLQEEENRALRDFLHLSFTMKQKGDEKLKKCITALSSTKKYATFKHAYGMWKKTMEPKEIWSTVCLEVLNERVMRMEHSIKEQEGVQKRAEQCEVEHKIGSFLLQEGQDALPFLKTQLIERLLFTLNSSGSYYGKAGRELLEGQKVCLSLLEQAVLKHDFPLRHASDEAHSLLVQMNAWGQWSKLERGMWSNATSLEEDVVYLSGKILLEKTDILESKVPLPNELARSLKLGAKGVGRRVSFGTEKAEGVLKNNVLELLLFGVQSEIAQALAPPDHACWSTLQRKMDAPVLRYVERLLEASPLPVNASVKSILEKVLLEASVAPSAASRPRWGL